MKTFVIGDIHGELKKLQGLIKQMPIKDDDKIVFLGDYVDRGPDPKGVIDFIINYKKDHNVITLKGNHEDMMLAALKPNYKPSYNYNPADEVWGWNGGFYTANSYNGIRFWNDIPEEHRDFFDNLELWHEDDTCYYVHAALTNNIPRETDPYIILWHRYESISQYELPKHLIYGHTPNKEGVLIQENPLGMYAICVDTGCGKGGSLTGICVDPLEGWEET